MSDYSREDAQFRGEHLTQVEFDDVFRLFGRWIEANGIKVGDLSELRIYAEVDENFRKSFDFRFDQRYLESKEYIIRGDEPVYLDGLIAERQGYETK